MELINIIILLIISLFYLYRNNTIATFVKLLADCSKKLTIIDTNFLSITKAILSHF